MKSSGACCIATIAGVATEESRVRRGAAEQTFRPTQPVWGEDESGQENPDLWLYRDRSVALLRRYVRLAVEIGRLPSVLGREFFRGRVTTYTVSTFEDTVIFVHDMEQSVEKLSKFDQAMIGKIVLEEYSQREAARILNCPLRTIERLFPEALDRLGAILLAGGIMTSFEGPGKRAPQSCQGGASQTKRATRCNHGK